MNHDRVIRLAFNQDHSCFACSMEGSVRIYNTDPLKEKVHLASEIVGSFSVVEMLHRTNLIALVAGGPAPKYADNTVLIWDESQKELDKKIIMEITFPQQVLNVRMRRDRLIVVLKQQIHVFSFPNDVHAMKAFQTRANPLGLCEINPGSEREVLVFPATRRGRVQVVDLSTDGLEHGSVHPKTCDAHEHELACLAINQQGTLVASASKNGTLIVISDTRTLKALVQLRRGSDTAKFYCMNFSADSAYLCASSDKGTVHVFAVKDTHLNRKSALRAVGLLGNYGESQWSLASFTVPSECRCVCAFAPHQSVTALCVDGTYHRYSFASDGRCERLSYDIYSDVTENIDF